MAITTRSAQIVALDKILDEIELNIDTRQIATELFSICQRFDRSMERERKFRAKKMGGGTNIESKKEMPPAFDQNSYVAPEKKSQTVQPVSEPEPAAPEPIEVEQKDETLEIKIFDLFTSGIEGAKASYPKAAAFKKALKDLGIQAEGKTHEDYWNALQLKFDEINNK